MEYNKFTVNCYKQKSSFGRFFRYFLSLFGLALEKDLHQSNEMWAKAINHCTLYTFDNSEEVQDLAIKLLVSIDNGQTDLWDIDLKNYRAGKTFLSKEYAKKLIKVCKKVKELKKKNQI